MRQSIAEAIGFGISKSRRVSGSTRIRIDLPDPRTGERVISTYVAAGRWQYVVCGSKEEAKNFQWFVIEKLNPALNRDRRAWNLSQTPRFEGLFEQLQQSPMYAREQFRGLSTGPGVYVFHHQSLPKPA